MMIYHGGTEIVQFPKIISSEIGRDFGSGFYTTDLKQQAVKWAKRLSRTRRKPNAVLNIYEFDDERASRILKRKLFDGYTMEWLETVLSCRKNSDFVHGYDIVSGNIADDDVGETVQAVVDGLAPKAFALSKLTYMSANHQICFCTQTSLQYLTFISAEKLV